MASPSSSSSSFAFCDVGPLGLLFKIKNSVESESNSALDQD